MRIRPARSISPIWASRWPARGGVPAKRVLNCLTLQQLLRHLRKRKACRHAPRDRRKMRRDAVPLLQDAKKIAEKIIDWSRPSRLMD